MAFLDIVAQEAGIAWAFNRRDLTATVVPFSLFTAASSLQAEAPWACLVRNTSSSALLGFLLLYTFTISNQLNGIEEDRLNKPDRPIVSGRVTIQGAYTRYQVLSVGALAFAYHMNVEAGAIMFMVFGALHNFTEFSSFGPTKDFLTTAVLTSGLHSAWEIGGGTTQSGLEWVFCLAVNLLFSISIQDLRDVVGDAATGRRTTPLMLGQPFDRIYISVSMLLTRALTLRTQYLQSSHWYTSKGCAALILLTDIYLVMRIFKYRDTTQDKKTYRLYMLRFCLELFCSLFVLSA